MIKIFLLFVIGTTLTLALPKDYLNSNLIPLEKATKLLLNALNNAADTSTLGLTKIADLENTTESGKGVESPNTENKTNVNPENKTAKAENSGPHGAEEKAENLKAHGPEDKELNINNAPGGKGVETANEENKVGISFEDKAGPHGAAEKAEQSKVHGPEDKNAEEKNGFHGVEEIAAKLGEKRHGPEDKTAYQFNAEENTKNGPHGAEEKEKLL